MPVCKGCGGSYDDGFKFCPYCGRAKPASETLKVEISVSSTDKWETCQIIRRVKEETAYSTGDFFAQAIGVNGKFLAGESPPFRIFHSDTDKHQYIDHIYSKKFQKKGYSGENVAHTFLVNQLVKDGWEAISFGGFWWETQFKRKVGKDYPKSWKVWVVSLGNSGIAKKYFTLYRLPDKFQDRPPVSSQFIMYGKSAEFKVGFLGKLEEVTKALDEFIKKLTSEGFEPLDSTTNNALRKCIVEETSEYWYYRVLLKR